MSLPYFNPNPAINVGSRQWVFHHFHGRKLMKRSLLLLIAIAITPSCVSPDMNLNPERKIRVVDSDKKQPVTKLPLVYQEFASFGLVVREVLTSRSYYTDSNGYAEVPSNVTIKPKSGTGYLVDHRRDVGKTHEEIQSKNVLYVRTREQHMKSVSEQDWMRRQ
jgi:hypothetical protein